jgi:5'-3' exonuclease
MGIHGFAELFEKSDEKNITELKNVDFAIDAYVQVFRNASKQYAANLTNSKGENTLYINIALQNILKGIALGRDDIWVFDNRDPRKTADPKQHILAERKEQKNTRMEKLQKIDEEIKKFEALEAKTTIEKILVLDPNYITKMAELRLKRSKLESEKDCGKYFDPMVRNLQFILRCLGVRMTVAPNGIDSEQACALLSQLKMVDYIMTTDTDTLLYGGTKMLKQKAKKTGKQLLSPEEKQTKPGTFEVWILEDVLKQQTINGKNLTQDDLIKIGVIIGCDFAPKTKGIGPGTVMKKLSEIELTPEQLTAIEIFKHKIKIEDIEIETPDCTLDTIKELETWLVNEQNFKAERVEKMLQPIRDYYNSLAN